MRHADAADQKVQLFHGVRLYRGIESDRSIFVRWLSNAAGAPLPEAVMRMHNLLIRILLCILPLQGAVTVLGLNGADASLVTYHATCAGTCGDDEPARMPADDKVSAATEELSDYLPFRSPVRDVPGHGNADGAHALTVLSIVPLIRTPPPRA